MNALIAVALGGALGALGRYGVQALMLRLFGAGFPLGTLTVNVAGSLLMGFLVHLLVARGASPELKSFLLIGCLGALTTFSTFSLDAVSLYERGAVGLAALYVAASVVLSIGALFAGVSLARMVTP
ncbi:fluoride efflux transporter CrcB [Minwuia thermotolerans]|uniref:Fluoride-specific ion channel FluC n=1 Tax=Minwuia thermotolerans TaxID=2056226 RepID=A0A2M9FYH8_9PROT|nr:fluoride efflux transporter CrcB [Minwuia thermotolerans]PJK28510.1 fluoride efflux transporter CrcB [Minwuia thermotolerans]